MSTGRVPGPPVASGAYLLTVLLLVVLALTASLGSFFVHSQQALNRDSRLLDTISESVELSRVWLVLAAVLMFVFFHLLRRVVEITTAVFTVCTIFGFFLIFSRALQYPFCVDDAYIYFRYIRNFFRSGAMQFNPGSPVLGFTSHLYVWILSAVSALARSDDLPFITRNLNIFLSLSNYLGVFALLLVIGLRPAYCAIGSCLYSLSSYDIGESTYGMESELLVLLLIIWLISFRLEKRALFSWAAVFIFLCRPEGLIFLIASITFTFIRERRNWIRQWAAPIGSALLYFLWVFITYGTIVPNSVSAKSAIYRLDPAQAFRSISAHFADSVLGRFGQLDYVFTAALVIVSFILLRKSLPLLLYLLSTILIAVFYAVGNPLMFSWYFAWFSLLPVVVVPMAAAATSEAFADSRILRAILPPAVLLLCLAPTHFSYLEAPQAGLRLRNPFFMWDETKQRLLLYREAASYLSERGAGTLPVGVCEDGMFGYAFPGPVLTLDGLAAKEVVKYYPLSDSDYYSFFAVSPRAIEAFQPRYVLFLENFGRNSVLKDGFFLANYEQEQFWDLKIWGGKGLLLYKKRSLNAIRNL